MEEAGADRFIASYALQFGSALAPEEPRAAATAILRIEALSAEAEVKPGKFQTETLPFLVK
jgi:hypothetical protein